MQNNFTTRRKVIGLIFAWTMMVITGMGTVPRIIQSFAEGKIVWLEIFWAIALIVIILATIWEIANWGNDQVQAERSQAGKTTFARIALTVTAFAVAVVYMTTAPQTKIAKFNCEQSGGTFSQNTCQCQKEPTVAGAPAFTYEESTGYCIDSFGIPGGDEGETAKKLQELQMLKNK